MSKDVREEIGSLAEKLPTDATWDHVMYEVYVRQKIAEGERGIAEGRTVDHEEIRKQFGLDPG